MSETLPAPEGALGRPRYTIRQALVWNSALVVVLLFLTGSIAIWQVNVMGNAVHDLLMARERAAIAFQVRQDSTELIATIGRLLPLKDSSLFAGKVAPLLDSLEQDCQTLEALASTAAPNDPTFSLMSQVNHRLSSVIGIGDTMLRQARSEQWSSVQVRVGVLTRDQLQLALETERLVEQTRQMEEMAAAQVKAARSHATRWPVLGFLIALAASMALSWWTRRGLSRPIERLTLGAAQLAAGRLDQRVAVENQDELGQLASAFNQMADRLQALYLELENRVAERTAALEWRAVQLQAAAEVARDAAAARELGLLLDRAAQLIRERFGFYHVSLFLVETLDGAAWAVLKAATGKAGRLLLASHYRLPVSEQSIVGYVTSAGQPRIALDVEADAMHVRHPLLPATRSELALPLKVGERVIGALDVQSERAAAFDQNDVTVLQTMADQLALAIENARLLHAAQQERNTLQATLNALPDLLFEIDQDGRIHDFRAPDPSTLYCPPREFLGQTVEQVLPPEASGVILEAIRRAAQTGRHTGALYRLATPGGSEWFELSIAAKGEPDAPQARFIAVARDVTARQRAEEAQRESERRFRTLYENAPIGIYRTTADGQIVMANPALAQMLGYAACGDLALRNLEEVGFGPDYPRSQFKALLEQKGEVKGLEAVWIRRDGSTVAVRENARAVRDEAGNVLYYEGTVEDITERKRAEEALRESEERYRTILENIEDGYYEVDLAGRMMFFNSSTCRIFGYAEHELMGLSNRQYMDAATARDVYQTFNRVYRTGQPARSLSWEIIRKDGNRRFIEASATLIRDAQGKPAGFRGIIRDVTDRKRAEEALQESEARFRAIFEQAGIGIALIDMDGKLLQTNLSLQQMLGYSAKELRGMSLQAITHPHDIEDEMARLNEARTGDAGGVYQVEKRYVRKDGQIVWGHLTATIIREAGGRLRYGMGMVEDITERKRAEESLQKRHHELALLNRLGQELTATLDLQQIIERTLQAALEIVGAQDASVWMWDTARPGELICKTILRAQKDPALILRLQPGQGVAGWVAQTEQSAIIPCAPDDPRFFAGIDEQINFRTMSILAVPLWARSKVVGVLEVVNKLQGEFTQDDLSLVETLAASAAIALDNAELVKALRQHAAELQASNNELDAYAHTVAHDLKNPLGPIVGYAEVLEEEYALMTQQEIEGYLHDISRNGRKMGNIIDELLLLSTVRQVEDVEIAPLDMAGVVAEAQERLADMVREHAAKISLPAAWPAAMGYAPWVEEVWVNYISNALKYGGQPPRVELGCSMADELGRTCGESKSVPAPPPGMVCFWVRDNGAGLDPEAQRRLFTPFTQLDRVRAKGHGLGLSIVQRIVEKLGGQVGVTSAPGAGSTFWFTLPQFRRNLA